MRIGISGHQNILPQSAVGWVADAIRDELRNRRASVGVSSLAAGTDQIFASIVLELGLELEAVIPCAGYESAFADDEGRARFRRLNEAAKIHRHLNFDEPSELAFLSAGQQVVDLADLMIFVWNGKPARGLGGTADIVAYAKAEGVPFIHLNPTDSSAHATV